MKAHSYIFESQRLGFRNWSIDDLDEFAGINNDTAVMEFFPYKPSRDDTKDFIIRMQQQYKEKGFCYFAVDILETNEFIGFIGLSEQSYIKELTPFVDIGWRLKKSVWNQGFATEGANACLHFGFKTIGLKTIYAVASEINVKSITIMKKVGMQKNKSFKHPKLLADKRLVNCVLYKL